MEDKKRDESSSLKIIQTKSFRRENINARRRGKARRVWGWAVCCVGGGGWKVRARDLLVVAVARQELDQFLEELKVPRSRRPAGQFLRERESACVSSERSEGASSEYSTVANTTRLYVRLLLFSVLAGGRQAGE